MEEIKFEKAIERLEKIVEVLENGEIPLDEALKRYEEGVKLSRLCSQKLALAEKKIEILTRSMGGGLTAQPFDPEDSDAAEKKEKQPKSRKTGAEEEAGEDKDLLF